MAVEAAKWQDALARLGFATYTVAGEGPVDHRLPGLAIGAEDPPSPAELTAALERADLVVVENLCSLPLNPGGGDGGGGHVGRPARGPPPPRPSMAATGLRPPSPTAD